MDHIFPQGLLKTVKIVNPESGKLNILRYRAEQRDQIANCMLLTKEENSLAENVIRRPIDGSISLASIIRGNRQTTSSCI